MSEDNLNRYFIRQGYSVQSCYWQNTEIELGMMITLDNASLVYRVEPDLKRILIVKFSRQQAKLGLSSPFKPLYILAEAAIQVLGKEYRLEGKVDVYRGSRLSNKRLARYYEHTGAEFNIESGQYSLLLANLRNIH
ncbi:type III secretion system regulator LcrR [Shewanella sp. VB17]|uniref:type III secretion system regulator LcrR n=1 Tax=Shewanella sp. VB17 TaxID=2739432 RepID=UPI001566F98B|nr:type III secretion system regulator LcrR [Shewanella sp. VB17]NRD71749.1 type III secretion system regulator LcrR [Shewanella sp. VB17]